MPLSLPDRRRRRRSRPPRSHGRPSQVPHRARSTRPAAAAAAEEGVEVGDRAAVGQVVGVEAEAADHDAARGEVGGEPGAGRARGCRPRAAGTTLPASSTTSKASPRSSVGEVGDAPVEVGRLGAGDLDHRGVDVAADDVVALLGQPDGDPPGAAAGVEHPGRRRRRVRRRRSPRRARRRPRRPAGGSARRTPRRSRRPPRRARRRCQRRHGAHGRAHAGSRAARAAGR